jgi:predicted HicB family RNase H-like nuclease
MAEQQVKQPQRVNLFLDPDVVLQAKVQALQEKISLSKLVDKALAYYLREQKK